MVSSGRLSQSVGRGALAALLAVSCLTGCETGETDPAPPGARHEPSGSASVAPEAPESAADRFGLSTGWGPTAAELVRAARITGRLSLPELAGQVIVTDYPGTAAPIALVRRLHLAGTIAFSANVASAQQVRDANLRLRRAVRRPLVVSVDQEGGIVERVRGELTRFPTFMSTGAADDPRLTTQAYAAAAAELAWAGFNLDFAPDADVTSGPADPTIGSRSPGSDPAAVAEHATAAARGLQQAGVLPVVKHFPGHGSVPTDSHRTLPVQTRSLRDLRAVDLVPFRAAVEEGLPAVMVGHLDIRAVHPRAPSTLSRRVVTGLLRDELGFAGVVVTDSLQMAALRSAKGPPPVVRALLAGADLLLMPPDPAVARDSIVRAVRAGTLPRRRLRQAAARTLAMLLHQRSTAPRASGAPGGPGTAASASRRLSAAALTSVAGPCSGDLVGPVVSPAGDASAVTTFAGQARAAGLEVLLPRATPARLASARPRPERRPGESRRHLRERREDWSRKERVRRQRLADWEAAERARLSRGTSVAFTGYGDGPVEADVAVAVDTPYVLGASAAPVRLATYGVTPGAMSALVDVLVGRARAPGRLPVHVAGVEREGC